MLEKEKKYAFHVTLVVLIITMIETVGLLCAWDMEAPPSAFVLATSAAFFGASRWLSAHPNQALFTTRVLMVMLVIPVVAMYKGQFSWVIDPLRILVCLLGIKKGAVFVAQRKAEAEPTEPTEKSAAVNTQPRKNKKN